MEAKQEDESEIEGGGGAYTGEGQESGGDVVTQATSAQAAAGIPGVQETKGK